jgi:hypothetical protein
VLSSLQGVEGETLGLGLGQDQVQGLVYDQAVPFELVAGTGLLWVLEPQLLRAARGLLAGGDRLQRQGDLGWGLLMARSEQRAVVPFRWDSLGLVLLVGE